MKFRTTALASTLALLGAASLGAQAASENLLIDNSTLATAQALGPLSDEGVLNVAGLRGTLDFFGTLFVDDNNADFYSFHVGANQVVTLRVDTPEGPVRNDDPMVALFAEDGTRLAVDDDGGPGYDALLTFTVNNPGTFYAAVTGFDDFDFDGIADLFEDEGSGSPIPNTNFSYLLQISSTAVQAPVPVPAAGWLLGSALLGLARRKRKAA